MTRFDRRQGLWALATVAGLATLPLLARRAAAQVMTSETLALVEKGDGRVAFYALPDGRRLGTVSLGTQPHEIATDRAGRFAYIGSYGVESWKAAGAGGDAIWVVDLQRRTLARTIPLAPYHRIHAVRTDAHDRLYALSETNSVLARFDAPASDNAPTRLLPLGGARSHYLVLRRDGARGYVADTMAGAVIMVDLADAGATPIKRALGAAPEALALSSDERTLFAIDRPAGTIYALDADTLKVERSRAMRGEAVRVVTQRDGRLVVSNRADRSLSRLDPRTLTEEIRLPLPAAAAGLTLSPDGGRLYAALESDRIAIVDLTRFTVAGGFPTGEAPDAAVIFSSLAVAADRA